MSYAGENIVNPLFFFDFLIKNPNLIPFHFREEIGRAGGGRETEDALQSFNANRWVLLATRLHGCQFNLSQIKQYERCFIYGGN